MKRPILFSIAVLFAYYLIACFVLGTFNLIEVGVIDRIFFVLFSAFPFMIIGYTITENQSFFFPPVVPHNEKIQGIRKYTGELKEELALYAEAKELERKVEELRNKQ